jgi:phosphoribosylformylglycinamidine synthase subunit PurQ / glutaminase
MKHAIVLAGDGINCEREMASALELGGAKTSVVHVNHFLENTSTLDRASILAIPGGFSFGDELRSGKVLAEKLRIQLLPQLKAHLASGGVVIGVCNGFQVLMQLDIFPNLESERAFTLATNDHGSFRDSWVALELTAKAKESLFFKGIEGPVYMPARHKEGRLISNIVSIQDPPGAALRYTRDFNGSLARVAALIDSTGQAIGIMPHPEAALFSFLHPSDIPKPEHNAEQLQQFFINLVKGSQK